MSSIPAPAMTRDQLRSGRRRLVRARTVKAVHLRLVEEDESVRQLPATRADCERGIRPCPFVSCRHHLYLDVSERTGTIKLNFPDLEVDELMTSCSLDVADGGPTKLEDLGAAMNVTRERARQIEGRALAKLASTARIDR